MNQANLQIFGFSPLADKIYSTLLKSGPVTIANLAKHVGKHRPAIYKELPALLSTKLVNTVKSSKRTLYQASSPTALQSILSQRIKSAEEAISEYTGLFNQQSSRPQLLTLDGRAGISATYEEILRGLPKSATIYRYESPRNYKYNKRYYPRAYWKRAGAAGDINKYVITNNDTHIARHKNLNRNSKALPDTANKFMYNITQIISKDITAFIDFDTETTVILKHARFAEFQKHLFKALFERL